MSVFIISFLFILLSVAFYILVERKCLGAIQIRMGPNKPGLGGSALAVGDGIKLMLKEMLIPSVSSNFVFLMGPMLLFTCYYSVWLVFPLSSCCLFFYYSGLFFLCVGSVSVFGLILCGWGSGCSYSLLGCVRASSQSISYEVVLSSCFYCPMVFLGSFDFWESRCFGSEFFLSMVEVFVVWVISFLAETNRIPFDFVEGESELVGGYMVEYGGVSFVLLILSEYSSLIFMSVTTGTLFFGAYFFSSLWDSLFLIFSVFISVLIIFVRGSLPRYRYDKLMHFCWSVLLPFIGAWLLYCVSFSV